MGFSDYEICKVMLGFYVRDLLQLIWDFRKIRHVPRAFIHVFTLWEPPSWWGK